MARSSRVVLFSCRCRRRPSRTLRSAALFWRVRRCASVAAVFRVRSSRCVRRVRIVCVLVCAWSMRCARRSGRAVVALEAFGDERETGKLLALLSKSEPKSGPGPRSPARVLPKRPLSRFIIYLSRSVSLNSLSPWFLSRSKLHLDGEHDVDVDARGATLSQGEAPRQARREEATTSRTSTNTTHNQNTHQHNAHHALPHTRRAIDLHANPSKANTDDKTSGQQADKDATYSEADAAADARCPRRPHRAARAPPRPLAR